jgi:phage host-nuclease inhibitor protein Gam
LPAITCGQLYNGTKRSHQQRWQPAMLDVKSATEGLPVPRLTKLQKEIKGLKKAVTNLIQTQNEKKQLNN